jgi:HEAT repeat protein
LLQLFAELEGEAKFRAGDYLVHDAASMNLPAANVVPAMASALRHKGSATRMQAALVLKQYMTNALPALPSLIVALRDDDRMLRSAAAEAIEAMGAMANEALPFLIAALDDPSAQDVAARALGAFGPKAEPAVPRLVQLLSDPKQFRGSQLLRSGAALSLGQIGLKSPTVFNALHTAAQDPDRVIGDAAAAAIAMLESDTGVK